MASKEVDIELDFAKLTEEIEAKDERSLLNPKAKRVGVRTTLFSLGKDPRIATEPTISSPDLRLVQLLKDGLKNPYVEVFWRIPRSDVDRSGVQGFNIFRRKIPREQFMKDKRREGEPIREFTPVGVSRLARGITKQGRFAPERKAMSQIKPDLLKPIDQNFRMAEFTSQAQARFASSLNRPQASTHSGFVNPFDGLNPIVGKGNFSSLANERRISKIGFVNYEKFIAQEKKKFTSVREREFVDLSFKDRSVVYGELYEYYVSSVSSDVRQGSQSNAVQIFVEDVTPIRPPKQLTVKLVDPTSLRLSIFLDDRDDVGRVLVFKKADGEGFFEQVATLTNISDCVNMLDTTVSYGKTYTYRVFAENIHGVLSEPKEVDMNIRTHKALPSGRSNNLKIPIISAIQDQNSDSIKITIAANDPRVSYYELERRNLTINEKKFSAPSKETTNLGGAGWDSNKLYVDKKQNLLENTLKSNQDLLRRRATDSEIEFIDTITQKDHIFQYRVRGRDLFGNVTSHAFAMVKSRGKQSVRTPVNVRVDVLRKHPFRLKLSWSDDNENSLYSSDELFAVESLTDPDDVKTVYKVQRRKRGETRHDNFPVTANQFLIDEVPASDNIPLMQKKVKDTFARQPNIPSVIGTDVRGAPLTNVAASTDRINFLKPVVRPFQTPSFMASDDVYFYRVAAVRTIAGVEEISNFSEEFQASTISELAEPLNFKALAPSLRVSPLSATLTWTTDKSRSRPDHWIIERKLDVKTDTFEHIGRAYITEKFYDKNLQLGSAYIYRIKSVDNFGRESDFFEARLTL